MSYNPFDESGIPTEERSMPNVIATLKMTGGFASNSSSFDKDDLEHSVYKPIVDQICEGILKNVGNNPSREYRLSIEGRGQASGPDTQGNTQLAVERAQAMRDSFHDYLLDFSATKNGETRSIRQFMKARRLYIRSMDVKPYFDAEKGTEAWTDGSSGDTSYQRAKVNIYYEVRG